MGVQSTGVLTPDDLNKTDSRVLGVLADGRVTPQYVAEELDVSRTYASERLKRLVEHGHVRKLASGLYELVDDPRDDVTADETDAQARLQNALEARDDAQARADRLADKVDDLEAQLEDYRERLADQDVDVGAIRGGVRAALSALEGRHPDTETATAELERVREELDDD